MEYVTLGKIVGCFGLKGELKVYSSTDFAASRYKKGNVVFLYNENTNTRIKETINGYRKDKNLDIISLKGKANISDVEIYVTYLVQIEKNIKDLPEHTYFHSDLLNCSVLDSKDQLVGRVTKIEEYCAYKTLRVSRENNKDVLIPFIDPFIIHVDIDNKLIKIQEIEGLL